MATRPNDSVSQREMTVVLIGKIGAGKSTLWNNLLDREDPIPLSPQSEPSFTKEAVTKNGVRFHIIDTPGLTGDKKAMKNEMKRLSSFTEAKADLLLYCLPVGPGSKFDVNPMIMKCLQDSYGKEIWQHCILVLTQSNLAWDHIKQLHHNPITAAVKYTAYIHQYAEKFKTELVQSLKVTNQNVTTILNCTNAQRNSNTFIAIPAGLKLEDPVLPGLDDSWKDTIMSELSRRYNPKCTPELLKYPYGVEAIVMMVKGGAIGGGVGGVLGGSAGGAIIGGVAGVVGGPVGIVIGAVAGGVAGGVAAGVTVGGAIGGGAGVGKVLVDKHKVDKEFQSCGSQEQGDQEQRGEELGGQMEGGQEEGDQKQHKESQEGEPKKADNVDQSGKQQGGK